jgi:hypothetical protein
MIAWNYLACYQNRTQGQYVCTNLVNPRLDFTCIDVPFNGENQLSDLEP